MIRDMFTIVWKEYKSGNTTYVLSVIIESFIFGVLIPYFYNLSWLDPDSYFLIMLVLLSLIGSLSLHSFTIEKEESTLPSLISSKINLKSILFGKVLFCITISLISLFIPLILGAITVNLRNGLLPFTFYEIKSLSLILLMLFSTVILINSYGVLISIHAKDLLHALILSTTPVFFLLIISLPAKIILGFDKVDVPDTTKFNPIKDVLPYAPQIGLTLIVLSIIILLFANWSLHRNKLIESSKR